MKIKIKLRNIVQNGERRVEILATDMKPANELPEEYILGYPMAVKHKLKETDPDQIWLSVWPTGCIYPRWFRYEEGCTLTKKGYEFLIEQIKLCADRLKKINIKQEQKRNSEWETGEHEVEI